MAQQLNADDGTKQGNVDQHTPSSSNDSAKLTAESSYNDKFIAMMMSKENEQIHNSDDDFVTDYYPLQIVHGDVSKV
ncbi:hypothetical protein MKW98_008534 [Papaver atlanticum]|uniref:Uncharacterized protein n=1 Tax=Papaver atlanticum TaxID=357466 RepID=A0AAD4T9V8_9MAGN|nr:hypothetical protein MKW98_008534 [Papaver atlanticum]